MFRRCPPAVSSATALPSGRSLASTIMWPTIWRMRDLAVGMTICGMVVASAEPALIWAWSSQERVFGVISPRSARAFAAASRSSVRTTRSTKPTVKSRPFGSERTAARRLAAPVFFPRVVSDLAAVSQVTTFAVALSARSARPAMSVGSTVLSAWAFWAFWAF